MNKEITLFWFRRDLRLVDNTGLYHALAENQNVLPLFIFDTDILDKLSDKADRRVSFIHKALGNLQLQLINAGSTLLVRIGNPPEVFKQLTDDYNIKALYANHDYEPEAISRDQKIADFLKSKGIPFYTFKDQVIFEKSEIVKGDGSPYTVFTPYSKIWKLKLKAGDYRHWESEKMLIHLFKTSPLPVPGIEETGFIPVATPDPMPVIHEEIIRNYDLTRNLPFMEGTSNLSVHLRFGTVSIRRLVKIALELNEQWLNELIWREFFMMILYHFPYVVHHSFREKYDFIEWRNNEEEFARWCRGDTGYPMVDAGMREMNETGLMHNRVRMVVASFLTKHLLIDWRWGEAWFAEKLLDFELSSNNGNWQWAAGTGCDAAPYFRIFNPWQQTERFDPQLIYTRRWVKNLGQANYPAPMVDHKLARERALKAYKAAVF
jgi:deoxyribodipyrimidine photo-lyase